jgi:Skp family chaperone for outer membrane proteins
MTSKFITSAIAAALVAVSAGVPTLAANSAQPTSVKFGYFNLALVKASYPEAAGSEALRVSAENQLRADVEEGNKRLQKMQEDKKEKAEIEKAARDLQTEINAKQQALIRLVQTQSAMATQAIAGAVAGVAKEKQLDVVVDGAGVFAGGEKLVNNGEDITEAIVKKLAPNAIRPGGGTNANPAPKTAAPAAK